MSSCGAVRAEEVDCRRGKVLFVPTYLFGLCQRGCDFAGDLGQPVDNALHHGGVAKVLERVTAKSKNLKQRVASTRGKEEILGASKA